MTMADFFTLTKYEGKIYKTNNMLGRTLAQYCTTDSAMAKEQRKIEGELTSFEKNIFGDQAKKDSLDPKAAAKARKVSRRSGSKSETEKTTKVRRRSSSPRSSGGSSAARVTVRRQRH